MVFVTTTNVLLSMSGAIAAIVLWKVISILRAPYTSALRNLPGPPSPSWPLGHLKMMFSAEDSAALYESWVERHGTTFKYNGWAGAYRLFTADTRAVNYIQSHSNDYWKPEISRFSLIQILGHGLLSVEGDRHRQQVWNNNPAFGPAQIRGLTEIFVEKAQKLCEFWRNELSKNGEPGRIEVLNGLSKMTLDVIGLAGFNYDFNSLNVDGKPNELNEAFNVLFRSLDGFAILPVLQAVFPPLRLLPDRRSRRIASAVKVMRRIGMELISNKKAEIVAAATSDQKEKNKLQDRDLLTLLLKSNLSRDNPESQRLSDKDVLAQVPTFLIAGHETTSNAVAWCLYALTQNSEIQQKLRDELWSVPTEDPTMDELNELPYLEAVVRETMRVHAPVPATERVAIKDDVILLNTPYVDIHGQVQDSVRVRKGDHIFIPIIAMNKSKALWGEDAFEFKPERWESIPDAVQTIPGVWANMMSFLGGAHSCIGFRFSVVEMKALVFALVRSFEFELAVPAGQLTAKTIGVQRPAVRGEQNQGCQLPLLIKVYKRN
ncbi:hypothetical protein IEO21_04619 [Rhodonia placenta]|uniref:Cytochrome P450 n=1 Tax=Rhodonia placenta TaxID=104341 RepID=A0A8H7U336_9APHY|nr:hypothetical protein IEO21_04619 [Postia placenta]